MSANKQTSKVATTIALCQRKSGVTLEQIAKLKISKVAGASLIGDARRKGVKVRFSEGRYRVVSAPPKPKPGGAADGRRRGGSVRSQCQ
jgi:hypothetical protein